MSVRCDITGKTKQYGHHVSFSQRKVPRVWKPNLQKKRLEINGRKVTLRVSAAGLRLLRKRGLLK
jgi:large subunit ribosomal protein L28